MRFRVTVAETAYTAYFVEAASEEEAKTVVGNQTFRATHEDWVEAGYGDDAEVIDAVPAEGVGA